MKRIPLALLLCCLISALSAQVDYRYYQSAVRDQADRGTCTAFAVCGMLETFTGVPSDLSEQSLYANVKTQTYVNKDSLYPGEFLNAYIKELSGGGAYHEEVMPYNPNAVVWDQGPEWQQKFISEIGGTSLYDVLSLNSELRRYKVPKGAFTYLDEAAAKDAGKIRELLDKGTKAIAVGYGIHWPTWYEHDGTIENRLSLGQILQVRDGDKVMAWSIAKLMYLDFYQRIADGTLVVEEIDTNAKHYNGHAVLIVGYNDKGFLIKNSWGEKWGDDGYGYIDYEYHENLCNEALAVHLVNAHDAYDGGTAALPDIRLKSLPEQLMGKKAIQLSIFCNSEGKMPEFTSIEYELVSENAALTVGRNAKTLVTALGAGAGYPTNVPIDSDYITWTVTLKYKTKNNPVARTKVFRNVGWRNDEYKAKL